MVHTLRSLQGRGGVRIPLAGTTSVELSPCQVREIVSSVAAELYPNRGYSSALTRMANDDRAARMIAERAAAYAAARSATAPAAPPAGGSGPKRSVVIFA